MLRMLTATGLYYIAELVEECSQLAKRVITCTVEVCCMAPVLSDLQAFQSVPPVACFGRGHNTAAWRSTNTSSSISV